MWQTTSVSKATAFHNISDTAGNSMATRIATSEGGSSSGGGWFSSNSGSSGNGQNTETNTETVEQEERKFLEERSTRSATVVECKRGYKVTAVRVPWWPTSGTLVVLRLLELPRPLSPPPVVCPHPERASIRTGTSRPAYGINFLR